MGSCLLVVDNDLGFAFWLARVLDGAGYQAFPARDVYAAFVLLREIAGLDSDMRMIIIGNTQSDAGSLVAHCRKRSPDLQVVWLRDGADSTSNGKEATAWARPAGPGVDECKDLLVAIGRLLAAT